MVTVKIPEEIQGTQLFEKIHTLIQLGMNSFELNVRTFESQKLIVSTDLGLSDSLEEVSDPIFLKELFKYMSNAHGQPEVVLNVQEPNLEGLIKAHVEEWGLKDQVKYTGQIAPSNFTPWDKPNIYYNVENCLPNFYQLEAVKKAHLDVIHYFCRKYKLKSLRIHGEAISEDILCWAKACDLRLSVCGVETIELAKELLAKGIDQVTTTDITNAYMKI